MRFITKKFKDSTSIEMNPDVVKAFDYMAQPDNVGRMIEATRKGKPALAGIVSGLESQFGDCEGFPLNHEGPGKNAKNRRNVGWMVRFIMREFGYMPMTDSERTRIGSDAKSKYFGNAAVYEKTENVPNIDIYNQAFVVCREMTRDDFFIDDSQQEYESNRLRMMEARRTLDKLDIDYEFMTTFLQLAGFGKKITIDDVEQIFEEKKVPCYELIESVENLLDLLQRLSTKKARSGYHDIYGSSTDKALRAFYELKIDPNDVEEVYVFFEEWDAILSGFYNVEGDVAENELILTDAPRLIIITGDGEYWFQGFTCGYAGQGCGGTQEVLYRLGILDSKSDYVDSDIVANRIMHYYKVRGVWKLEKKENSMRENYHNCRGEVSGMEGLYDWNNKLVLTQALKVERNKHYEVIEPTLEWMRASDYFLDDIKRITFLSQEEAKKQGRYEKDYGTEYIYQIIIEGSDSRELWLTYPFEEFEDIPGDNLIEFVKGYGIDLDKEVSQSGLSKIVNARKSIYQTYATSH